jgi:predicted ATP-dependent Lon-type protease
MQSRVHLGGALSGRDIEAVNKTVSGLAKLLFPDPAMPTSQMRTSSGWCGWRWKAGAG